jgi:hypothetical protein
LIERVVETRQRVQRDRRSIAERVGQTLPTD